MSARTGRGWWQRRAGERGMPSCGQALCASVHGVAVLCGSWPWAAPQGHVGHARLKGLFEGHLGPVQSHALQGT